MSNSDYLSLEGLPISDVAEILHVAPKTVYRLIGRGELRAVHVGRAVRVLKSDLVAYLRGGDTVGDE